ncbi:family 43 glycosylhydrolase [Marinimicrobium alkaliphilum]|uniref:family 43 glycosylhydrolase n=1 Tax=Marinimicrobium alkaliphilum TaxID=2202654 RepID=UPI000DB9DC5F|nr:family 43 glycosylhydrolase [Marinimicrobium alkaliphilum]
MKKVTTLLAAAFVSLLAIVQAHAGNPVIRDRFTADPALLVHDGRAYLYAGHDEAAEDGNFFVMNEWVIYSSDDMLNWQYENAVPRSIFEWARRPTAWAAQAIERDGKFYWYVTVLNDAPDEPEKNGFAIGVAVSDNPVDGWRDALGGPLVSSDMTEAPAHMQSHETWDNIDPTVYIDDDGQAFLYWGNSHLYYAKLKDNMLELDGDIVQVEIQDMPGTFTEGPYLHKHNDTYYMTYAMDYPERIGYATAPSLEGPWSYGGLLLDVLPDTGTSHPAVEYFDGQWYFIYHTAALPTGGNYRRAVSIEKFDHNADGSIDQLIATASGIAYTPYRLQVMAGPNHFLRHQNRTPKIANPGEPLLSPNHDERLAAYDYKWHVVPGLANDGSDYVSLQAENLPGFYLKRTSTGRVIIAKHDGSDDFERLATFKKVRGLADRQWTSLQAYGERNKYLVQRGLDDVRVDSVSRNERERATFRLQEVTE